MYAQGIGRMPAEPNGAAATRTHRLCRAAERVTGQERGEVGAHADRADAGSAATVGDAERLVQVEVADVGTEVAGPGDADEGVEVGAVDVHLPAGPVDGIADLADRLLEHAVRRRVGEHDRGQAVADLGELGA